VLNDALAVAKDLYGYPVNEQIVFKQVGIVWRGCSYAVAPLCTVFLPAQILAAMAEDRACRVAAWLAVLRRSCPLLALSSHERPDAAHGDSLSLAM
jgi:hypothetical protein